MKKVFLIFQLQSFFLILLLMSSYTCKAQESNINNTKSITAILTEKNSLPIEERMALYQELKIEDSNARKLEEDMNLYGYQLLWADKVTEAIEVFKVIVEDNPNSANAYDSLAEAFLANGNKEQSLIYYKKAFAMDPDNFNAQDQIERIKNPNQKKLTPEEKFSKKYSVMEYRTDLDQLKETLLKVHPNALKFITEAAFNKLIDNKKDLININTTYAEFAWHCNEIIASVNCSHTGAGRFYWENKMLPIAQRFPLQTRLIDNRLFVIDPLNNDDKIKLKDEITSINGVSVKDITLEAYKRISSQGFIETTKRHEFNRWSTGMISYALGFPNEYSVQLNGKEASIVLKETKSHNDPQRDDSKIYCGDELCLEYLDTEKKIAVMTISSFNYYRQNNFSEFERFIDESMMEMIKYGTDQLVLDVRGNGGGSPESSIHLLKYLIHEPFVYYSRAEYDGKMEKVEGERILKPFDNGYKGKLQFIIDGLGNSTTGHFMSIVKERKLGTIIGEELGSNQFCSAGRKPCRLSNTKMEYSVANNTHVSTATSLPDEVGILPDYEVTQSIDEYMEGKDAVKDFTISLIAKERDWENASEYHSSYFLKANNEWRKELFRIPLNFAPDISLRGVEDARFPVGWEVKDSSTFWSYVFAWNVDSSLPLTTEDFSENIELYFNGLMNIVERGGKEFGITESTAIFTEVESSNENKEYTGILQTFDGFFEKKPLTFNVKAKQQFCKEIGRAVVIFSFSPKPFENRVWDKLDEVKLPLDICKK